MSHERLAALIHAHQEALVADPEVQTTHEAMISLLQGLDTGEITPSQCVRLLRYQALMVAHATAYAKLYLQAAVAIQHMQRGEQGLERSQR